eukprot:gene10611-1287_t
MAVTSTTTMASFYCTASSSFPGIQTFGIYAALLVLVNYAAADNTKMAAAAGREQGSA